MIQLCISCQTIIHIALTVSEQYHTQPKNTIGETHFHDSYFLLNIDYYMFLIKLNLLSGDIETNPGPSINSDSCLSIIHQNIRSVRNKLEYIQDNYLDFDILCLTETHLSQSLKHRHYNLKDLTKYLGKTTLLTQVDYLYMLHVQ